MSMVAPARSRQWLVWGFLIGLMGPALSAAILGAGSAAVQDLSDRAPADVVPGPAVISGQVIHRAVDGSWLEIRVQGQGGTFLYQVTLLGTEAGELVRHPASPAMPPAAIAARAAKWEAIKAGPSEPLLWLEGEVTKTAAHGAEIEGRFAVTGAIVRLRFQALESYPAGSDPAPTYRDVSYGGHVRQKMDVYLAKSSGPSPVVVYIHGGSWRGGDKNTVMGQHVFLEQGISLIAINYRYIPEENPSDSIPAVAIPFEDAARALQFIRSKAGEWGLDRDRIGIWGRSAGACTGLWLATHANLANPSSPDPISRESTRPACVAALIPQTSLDPVQMRAWVGPQLQYGPHAFAIPAPVAGEGGSRFDAFVAARERLRPWIAEYSPAAMLRRDTPAIFMDFLQLSLTPSEPLDAYYTHSPGFGVGLLAQARTVGAECSLRYDGHEDSQFQNWQQFLIAKLKGVHP
jgi:acetyl esterase/lipase